MSTRKKQNDLHNINSHSVTDEEITIILKTNDCKPILKILELQHLTTEHLNLALNNKDWIIRIKA
jgi:hypothetical protein